ncbi:unnamed protein product [Phaeothamnion confervicola]
MSNPIQQPNDIEKLAADVHRIISEWVMRFVWGASTTNAAQGVVSNNIDVPDNQDTGAPDGDDDANARSGVGVILLPAPEPATPAAEDPLEELDSSTPAEEEQLTPKAAAASTAAATPASSAAAAALPYLLCVMRHSVRLDEVLEAEEANAASAPRTNDAFGAGGSSRSRYGKKSRTSGSARALKAGVGSPGSTCSTSSTGSGGSGSFTGAYTAAAPASSSASADAPCCPAVAALLEAHPWPDRATRRYDTPIADYELPAQQAAQLRAYDLDIIVASPFRRCLQTAGAVARALGRDEVVVDLAFGERMDKVRQDTAAAATKAAANAAAADAAAGSDNTGGGSSNSRSGGAENGGSSSGSSNGKTTNGKDTDGSECGFSYLTQDEMQVALGPGVRLARVVGTAPHLSEGAADGKRRYIAALRKLAAGELQRRSVLVVGHGDMLDAAAEAFCRSVVFEAAFCAWAVIDPGHGAMVDGYGLQCLPLDEEDDA